MTDTLDANGVPMTMKYDRFGRLREANYPDGNFARIATFGPLIHFTQMPDGAGNLVTTELVSLDALGRLITQGVPSFAGGLSVTRTVYDRRGRISTMSRPFLSGSTTTYDTTYQYDDRNRLIKIIEPDQVEINHDYLGLETHTYDGRGFHSYIVARPDGRIDARYEDDPNSDEWLSTHFEYGPFGVLTKTTAPDDTSQIMEYDELGRRTKHIDPSAGTTTSTYNAFNELTQEIDGSSRTTDFAYDPGPPQDHRLP